MEAMQLKSSKSCIIFSYGPVPSPEHDKVEGGGLRCWGIAKGLRSQDKNLEITVAYHESYKKDDLTPSFESIDLATWNNESIEQLISDFDTIIVSYCMGDLSVNLANTVKSNQQLVLDCYVPIYTEISARDSKDLEGEYTAFKNEVDRWAAVLRRGDIYLCANENQKRYYQGVLSALGRINPATYSDELLLTVPYGIYKEQPVIKSKPISALLSTEEQDYKRILWFGAVYPWFDLRTLVEAVKKLNKTLPAKLVIVGAKNPFNAHPDFVSRYNELIEYIENDPEAKSNIILQDWVEFNDRADWYLDSDLVILINKIGGENELAWRTRLVDYMWADLPIITNGGDPLGEELIAIGAASRLDDLSSAGLSKSLSRLLTNPQDLEKIKKALSAIRKKYYWEIVTRPLYDKVISHSRPTDFTKFGLLEVHNPGAFQRSIPGRIMAKSKKVPAYYAKHGARTTYTALRTVALQRIQGSKLQIQRGPRVIFVSHQLDTTGAPHVLIDLVRDFRKGYPQAPIEFHTFNPVDRTNVRTLNKIGVKPMLHISRDINLRYVPGDVVILNTVAFSDIMRESIYENLESGTISKLIWYIHEDEPSYIFGPAETKRIKRLMDKDILTIFTAAIKTSDHYKEHFNEKAQILTQIYRVNVLPKYHKEREAQDFKRLDFILPGMAGDGRKGQLPILYAFIEFKKRYFDPSPEKYRQFSLCYIGVGKDFLSRQILKHSQKGLGDAFKHYGPISHEACLDLVLKANVTICYSMRECLPMFVYEGMVAGHPLMRNDSSGLEEQLVEKENGYYLESTNLEQVIQAIENICNKAKTSDEELAKMSKKSYEIASKLEKVKYDNITNSINEAYAKN
jgi:glycosyltransferase involved in cell wall biosynthesis